MVPVKGSTRGIGSFKGFLKGFYEGSIVGFYNTGALRIRIGFPLKGVPLKGSIRDLSGYIL